MTYQDRYQRAHEHNFKHAYPQAYADGLYSGPKMPKIKTANGLTTFICNFLLWHEHRATRVNVMGRLVEGKEKHGNDIVTVKKYIPSSTRRGTSDISATIRGRSVMIEIKIGADRPSPYQLAEQVKERRAGGIYEFVSSPSDFFNLYDSIMNEICTIHNTLLIEGTCVKCMDDKNN